MNPLFVLIHSPLVGPLTWAPTMNALCERGVDALAPPLHDGEDSDRLYWRGHVRSIVDALADVPSDRSLVLIGHSGAGPLLPAIGDACPQPVAAYLWVDAGLPSPGLSRLDALRVEDRDLACELQTHLEAGGRFPEWSMDDLSAVISDEEMRSNVVAELRPQPLSFFIEPLPRLASPPNVPCAYVQFSAAYDQPALRARQNGWPHRHMNAGHFHMLVDPSAVADAMISLVHAVGVWR